MQTTTTQTAPEYSPALQMAVEAALAAFPDEAARIHRGAAIVQRGEIREPANGKGWLIGIHGWEVDSQCNCLDARARGRRCKHWFAKALYRKMRQQPTVRTLRFVATWNELNGICTVYESGAATFAPYDTDELVAVPLTQWHQIVLGGRVDLQGATA